jgi:uncharacterized membrane protein
LQFIVYVTVFFDVPVVRQVVGFVYFTFIPGLVIIKMLKLDKQLNRLETCLFAIGFSIFFLMIVGLFINELAIFFGLLQPLSLMPLMIILNGVIFVMEVLVHINSGGDKLRNTELFWSFRFTWALIFLPILSIVGAVLANTAGNNLVLLLIIMAISLIFVINIFSEKLLYSKSYSFVVFMIAISLLYHSSFISNYLTPYGSDSPREHFIFKNTLDQMYWESTNPYVGDIQNGRIHSMLSVTILPTIYSTLLNINSTWVFKLLYPIIFSFVPLILYRIWEGYLGKKYAFISTFLLMSNGTFYGEMLGLNRQMIAELFFALLLLVILSKKLKSPSKMVLFMIFSFCLVTSHYGIALIFLLIIILAYISLFLVKKPSTNITWSMIVFFLVIMYSWYIFTSSSASFDSLTMFCNNIFDQLSEFLNLTSRQEMVLRGVGLENPPSILNAISRAFAYATELLIVIGFVGLVTRRVKVEIDGCYFVFISISMAFLAALILVPGLAATMNITRFYHILLFFLAPLCAFGAYVVSNLVSKQRRKMYTSIILVVVLVPFFLFQTSFIYEVTGSESWSVPLSRDRMSAYKLYLSFTYIWGEDVYSAEWVSKNIAIKSTQIYADISSRPVLLGYGLVPLYKVTMLTNVTSITKNGAIYLDRLNVIEGMIVDVHSEWNATELLFSNGANKVYSNGWSEIYRNVNG